ncbi:LysR family transcriptional regulator [Priestia sp. FSL R5-0597]|uniref:LysR family transcriptional regulator n=1 Tax=Priestia TaxID=2800373 RepID=UPI0012B71E5C|nr:LysR family transcriptional regulator [Priestia megaterium]
MNINHLKIFISVVEEGGFTKASEVLSITQSGVSHAIISLEKELGVSLLARDRLSITLTEAGERILPHCKEILSRIDQIHQESYQLLHLEKGKVKIGSFPSAMSQVLPKILATYQRKYPLIEVVLFEGTDQEVVEWLENKIIDIAFISTPQPKFSTVSVSKDRLFAIINVQNSCSKKGVVEVLDMVEEPFIMSKGGCEPLITSIFQKYNIKPNIKYKVHDIATILAMVEENLGWTIIPEKALPNYVEKAKKVPLFPTVWREIGIAFHPTQRPYAVEKFIEEVNKM